MCMDNRQQHVKGFVVSGLLAKSECNSDCSQVNAPSSGSQLVVTQNQSEMKLFLAHCSFKVFGSGK